MYGYTSHYNRYYTTISPILYKLNWKLLTLDYDNSIYDPFNPIVLNRIYDIYNNKRQLSTLKITKMSNDMKYPSQVIQTALDRLRKRGVVLEDLTITQLAVHSKVKRKDITEQLDLINNYL